MEKAFITKDLDIFKKKPLSLLTSSQKRIQLSQSYYITSFNVCSQLVILYVYE